LAKGNLKIEQLNFRVRKYKAAMERAVVCIGSKYMYI
jgi:hypothetical protein